jgi:hypothetical protein
MTNGARQMAPADSSSIKMISLDDFDTKLAARLSEVESMLTMMRSDPVLTAAGGAEKDPKLGNFEDANREKSAYHGLYQQYLHRLEQLHDALTAARSATATIMHNYHTTETLNAANANDISSALAGVSSALGGQ